MEKQEHRRRNVIGTLVTLLVLGAISVFAWRVYHFATLIQSGDLTNDDLLFFDQYTASQTAAKLPVEDGEFDVTSSDDPMLGSESAAVTIVEFADFGCPYSRTESLVMRTLATVYSDQIRYIYRDFPVDELHPAARRAAEAGECAQEQDMFWEYHDKVYQNQTDLSDESLVRYAREINMNAGAFERCLKSGRYTAEVQADYDQGLAAGVRGTPTFFINGNRIVGAIPENVFTKMIDRLLAPATSTNP